MSDPAVVQSCKADPGVGASIAFTLSGSPTTGNILIAFINFGQFGVTRTVTPPDGSWVQVDTATQTFDSIDTWKRVVVGGDGTGWTFTLNDAGEFCSGVMCEVSNQDATSPINQHGTSKSSGTTSLATASVTPSVLNCLAISAQTQDNNSAAATTVGSGWTIIQTASSGSGRGGNLATKNVVTADTVTAISTTWTLTNSTETLSAIVLVGPTSSGGGRTTKNTRAIELGVELGMNIGIQP
jgi:hypothetical protein